ncbi:2-oxo-4-hydroxy-4-carboxy-5-ureidoimidazoline decarboxylase [Jiangella endophytica]|uniref:2-oxo-4-hydroxy-4-carboxy-5-ureidoimidazoline decarboxylase n=1 Tax=Jiangella endophytica TaxID=1623398 RepID=UPI000E346354|nr:2-oxo-4-hydroxy-4-carboxy-5-ureidoimidazoline decarboxylase [Jiangella endophytica]
MTSGLAVLNELARPAALDVLRQCCAARAWAGAVVAGRPYDTTGALLAASDATVATLGPAALDEALAGHPRIGERTAHGSWSAAEQSGLSGAGDDVQRRLSTGNHAYEERFGHVYLVRAAGRSAAELLALLESRLGNDPDTEREVVRGQLAEITRLRLAALLDRLTTEGDDRTT